jgi:protein-S-isoprenylcysteine O-methyltransferase Ste14
MRVLYTVAWVIAIIYATIPSYWLLVHPHIDFWRARKARLSMVGPLWIALWMIVGAITRPWRTLALYRVAWAWIPAAALILTGVFVYARARRNFSTDQVLGRSELEPPRHEQRLNTSGIRARVRHPYYLGHLCELFGWTMGTGLAVLYGLTIFTVITGALMIAAEERELESRFGQAYRDYQQRVPAILPRLRFAALKLKARTARTPSSAEARIDQPKIREESRPGGGPRIDGPHQADHHRYGK